MRIEPTRLPGVFVIENDRFADERGFLVKTYAEAPFAEHGLSLDFRESFFSTSGEGVVRGMHFQLPPHEHVKLVTPLGGRVLDVILDLRRGSPTEGEFISVELDAAAPRSVYIAAGCAHGFTALSDDAMLLYHVTSAHAPSHDSGIRWDSFGFEWPLCDPVVSTRDAALPALADLDSPFVFGNAREGGR